jgi:hypothetical protein
VLVLAGSLSVRADVWDTGTVNDNDPAETRNELTHGLEQIHDIAAQAGVSDVDWFPLTQQPYSSYVAIVDGLTSDAVLDLALRDGANPALKLQAAASLMPPSLLALHMGIFNNSGVTKASYVRVAGSAASCTTTCDANDQYRIRFFDTTYLIPRFNNANGQVTVLMVQNGITGSGINWTANYWSNAGVLLAQVPSVLQANQSAVINLSTIPALQGQTGTITIAHTAGFGGMAVKSVALEPATGFSFDTLGTYRAR